MKYLCKYGECSKCGGELKQKEPHAILTSHPPQIALYCVECGNVEYMRLETPPAEFEEKRRLNKLFERVNILEKKVAKLLGETNEIHDNSD